MTGHSQLFVKVLAAVAVTTVATAAVAQDAAQSQTSAQSQAAPSLEEIVVTGSRIARSSFESNTPIATISDDQLKQAGVATVEERLSQMPQFSPDRGEQTALLSGGGYSTVNLRALGAQRTLVLLDGERLVAVNGGGIVDTDNIPTSLLESVEVITGGASAVYGSDAIAGVVNFKLKDHFQGIQIDAQRGQTFQGDGVNENVSFTVGSDFDNNRGNAVVFVNYFNRDNLIESSRSFFDQAQPSTSVLGGRTIPDVTNLPSQGAVNNVFAQYGAAPGTVLNTRSLGFNNDGTLYSQQGPPIVNYRGTSNDVLNTGTALDRIASGDVSLIQPLKRYEGFSKITYNVTDDVQLYTKLLFSQNVSATTAGPLASSTIAGIPVTNPFIPASLATVLASRPNPTATFSIAETLGGLGARTFQYTNNDYQGWLGLKGKLGLGDWTWDTFASYGRVDVLNDNIGNDDIPSLTTLLTAKDGGASICAGGLDLFGVHPISAACQAYIGRITKNETISTLSDIEATTTGTIVQMPAGPLKSSVGVDYRSTSFTNRPDSSTFVLNPDGSSNFSANTYGVTTVYEVSGELLVPLLKDLPLVKSFDADLGARYSEYNITGEATTYKADANWQVVSDFHLRGGYEHAIRAPNANELFGGAVASTTAFGTPATGGGDPCDVRSKARTGPSAAAVQALCVAQGLPTALANTYTYSTNTVGTTTVGSTSLQPEKADTFTVGGVWTPHIGSDPISISVDYYNIAINNVISPEDPGTALSKCYNLDGSNPGYSLSNPYCQLFTRNTNTGNIQNFLTPDSNLGGYRTSGVDMALNARTDLGLFGIGDGAKYGFLTWALSGTYLADFKIKTIPSAPFQQYAGTIAAVSGSIPTAILPVWKGYFSVNYNFHQFEIGATARYLDAMHDISYVTNPASPAPGVPAVTYVDLNASWAVTPHLDLRFGVINLFDKGPPVVGGTPSVSNSSAYDAIGVRYFLGATLNL